jgi:hypothetical protein
MNSKISAKEFYTRFIAKKEHLVAHEEKMFEVCESKRKVIVLYGRNGRKV